MRDIGQYKYVDNKYMWMYIYIAAGLVVFALVGFLVYKSFFTTSGFSTISDGPQKTPELMFFFADWCPHCKTAKPEWTNTKDYLDENLINNQKIYCVDYNCSEKTPEIEQVTNEYKIEGFPTIKLQYDNTIHDFNQTPTKDNILAFLNTIIK